MQFDRPTLVGREAGNADLKSPESLMTCRLLTAGCKFGPEAWHNVKDTLTSGGLDPAELTASFLSPLVPNQIHQRSFADCLQPHAKSLGSRAAQLVNPQERVRESCLSDVFCPIDTVQRWGQPMRDVGGQLRGIPGQQFF
jgi:hypothetical protein